MDKFEEYINNLNNINEDKCWSCNKSLDQIREAFLRCKEKRNDEYEDLNLDDIIIMTYKLKKPICAGCYFHLKENEELIKEVLKSSVDEIW